MRQWCDEKPIQCGKTWLVKDTNEKFQLWKQ